MTVPAPAGTRYQTTCAASTQCFGDSAPAAVTGPTTVHSTLSPSLRQDLLRFVDDTATTIELLPALAACVRHARSLALQLELDGLPVRATIHPREQLFRSSVDLAALAPAECRALRLVGVEPDAALPLRPPAADGSIGPLRPLLWHLAMHGARAGLLPELQGPVRYRMAPGIALKGLPVAPELERAITRLKALPCGLDELAAASGLGCAVVQRLLNALYLQSGLMLVRAFGAGG